MQIKRIAARHMLIDLANVARLYSFKPYRIRHINQAVFCVRQHRLAGPELLERAGFRAKRSQ